MTANKRLTNAELQAKVEDLSDLTERQSRMIETLLDKLNGDSGSKEEEKSGIRPDEQITVVSNLPFTLNLNVGIAGRRPYTFTHRFQRKPIPYVDVARIIETNQSFASSGFFIVLDERIINMYGLAEDYEKVLSQEEMQTVLTEDMKVAYPIFKIANKRIQKLIAQALVTKLVNGEDVDMNLVYAVSKDTGIDIQEAAEDLEKLSVKTSD